MQKKKSSHPAISLMSGGTAGLFEALCCHPLDTIKVRMQIYKRTAHAKPPGFIKTGVSIFKNEGFIALYKGLGAVVIGIIPKMAIRFSSYEYYRTLLANKETGVVSTANTFISGLGAGVTEAVMVVNPMEVVKIRLQSQHLKPQEPGAPVKYRNAVQACYTIVKEEGFQALYRGVSLTAARQATNQGANFTAYSKMREALQSYHGSETLSSWETSCIGLISGAIGPFSNAPLDTIKTRLQKEGGNVSKSGWKRIVEIGSQLVKEEGFRALYKGITPRVMRVAPGQAVTFTVYEFVRRHLEASGIFSKKPEKPKSLK
ncbi:probable Succinate/fumarate mitochondrial transporter [Zygosaccharomyces bailii]|uniref:ZYBA0S06-04610g1_1 n=1 Tax=Zygosaccharomyces bailii (strain CLIB 213 / ATCC 58445 / CBS 680 / BCRC 21525 / NBRC 1098 / NCYC 1416 / NRRL Y-2227) TaxID=1333698 RepID=A0A8J2X8Z4_ZYGB2|nr:ZYBA0S06-04610g1_1 [Zygosaccharomyces bailii CLIB 213]CDH16513.1 probable Succinate/fumarate mitochondrial transporter [Zygosaccharomyces bailii ISA1307]SJM84633.1 probable Succinate/fumarate mitochondrial transporter [Zygosaccharomyces bailii]